MNLYPKFVLKAKLFYSDLLSELLCFKMIVLRQTFISRQ